jgi:hypothetical protein
MHISCEVQEDALEHQHNEKNSRVRFLYGKEALEKAKLLRNQLTLSQEDMAYRTTNNGTIDYSKIIEIIDTSGVANYTFKVTNHPDDSPNVFHNVVLSQKNDGTQKVVLLKYDNDYPNHKIQEFKGEITIKDISISPNPCDDISIPFDFTETNPSNGSGDGYIIPIGSNPPNNSNPSSSGAGAGSQTVSDLPAMFHCNSCDFSSSSLLEYLQLHQNGNGVPYPFTISMRFGQRMPNVSANPCDPVGEIGVLDDVEDPKTPCERLKSKSSQAAFKNRFNALNTSAKYALTNESGYFEKPDGNGGTTFTVCAIDGNSKVVIGPSATSAMHVHQNETTNSEDFTVKMLSVADINGLFSCGNHRTVRGLDSRDAYMMMLSSTGVYSIMITDPNYNGILANLDWDDLNKKYSLDAYNLKDEDGNFNPTQEQLQQLLFKTLKRANLLDKVALFKATNVTPNSTATPQWAQINPITLAEKPCN